MLLDAGAQNARTLAVDDVYLFQAVMSVAPSRNMSTARMASSSVMPRTSHSVSTVAGRDGAGFAARSGAFLGAFPARRGAASRTLTLSFQRPACTVTSPLLSGAVSASPRVFEVRSIQRCRPASDVRGRAGLVRLGGLDGFSYWRRARPEAARAGCAVRVPSRWRRRFSLRFSSAMTCSASRCALFQDATGVRPWPF